MHSLIFFCAGTKVFEEALNAVKFSGWFKKFGSAQNILGPVKGQGKSTYAIRIMKKENNIIIAEVAGLSKPEL